MKRCLKTLLPVLLPAVIFAFTMGAQDVLHLNFTQPGGFPGHPVMTGIYRTNNSVTLTWDGPSGYYQLYQTTNLLSRYWEAVGGPNLNRNATLTNPPDQVFFKVLGPAAQYAGSLACAGCHRAIYNNQMETGHAHAWTPLEIIHQDKNPACIVCHAVGYGLPTGFTSLADTRHLANVQCENCHGPAASHAANPRDLSRRPRAEIAGQVCGGCHNSSEGPFYSEWKASGHATVVEDLSSPGLINNCGRCHSGTVRLALVHGADPSDIPVTLANDANVGLTCVVCHDPHAKQTWTNVLTGTAFTNQLRYPLTSTNYISVTSGTTFTNRLDINVCAQCHNDFGANWAGTRPPHHSPQYNMLMGTVGLLPAAGAAPIFINSATNANPATHALYVEKQCVTCHMQTTPFVDEEHPAQAGHTFKADRVDICQKCHAVPDRLNHFNAAVATRIEQLKVALNQWAATRAPAALREQYGLLAWEFSIPGTLSSGVAGPTAAEQALIPARIKYARFNLYVAAYDGSLGTHNPMHIAALLDAADAWVQAELSQ
ncbi:MAG: hypothetical protein M9920_15590 [Verrucomicrobiae bacterium]|nr:hypothetical protein [Verrucomicrobiae bacterium]